MSEAIKSAARINKNPAMGGRRQAPQAASGRDDAASAAIYPCPEQLRVAKRDLKL
jgi:hypothetical protein